MIVCHPSKESFTRAVADRYVFVVRAVGHEVELRDLYAIGFDPVLKDAERPSTHGKGLAEDVGRELELLAGSHIFVLVCRIGFGMPPAMLKGYVDRVFGAGFSHRAVRGARADDAPADERQSAAQLHLIGVEPRLARRAGCL